MSVLFSFSKNRTYLENNTLILSSAVNVVAKCLTQLLLLFTESEISHDTAFFSLFLHTGAQIIFLVYTQHSRSNVHSSAEITTCFMSIQPLFVRIMDRMVKLAFSSGKLSQSNVSHSREFVNPGPFYYLNRQGIFVSYQIQLAFMIQKMRWHQVLTVAQMYMALNCTSHHH